MTLRRTVPPPDFVIIPGSRTSPPLMLVRRWGRWLRRSTITGYWVAGVDPPDLRFVGRMRMSDDAASLKMGDVRTTLTAHLGDDLSRQLSGVL